MLDDLKGLLREKAIMVVQWVEGSAAIRRKAAAARPAPVAVRPPALASAEIDYDERRWRILLAIGRAMKGSPARDIVVKKPAAVIAAAEFTDTD